jgi:hypothetical protein
MGLKLNVTKKHVTSFEVVWEMITRDIGFLENTI